jgi:transposase
MDYILKRWAAFTRFLDVVGSASPTTPPNARCAELLSDVEPGYFAGSDRGGERAAFIYSLIVTAKMNDIDPQAWLAEVLRRINDHLASQLYELLPWHWKKPEQQAAAA